MKTIGYITTTIGRATLPNLIGSFKEVKGLGDELLVIGDGWEEPWIHDLTGEGVRFVKKPKGNEYGYSHRKEALDTHALQTDMIGLCDDDDVFFPGSFSYFKRKLSEEEGKGAVGVMTFPLVSWDNYQIYSSAKYWRLLLPNRTGEWSMFGANGWSDGSFYLSEFIMLDHIIVARVICEANKTYRYTEKQWKELGVWGKWNEELFNAHYDNLLPAEKREEIFDSRY
jgi:hypothetical protein